MARQNIFTGTVGNDGTGDDLRTGATKINANFTELYSNITALSLQLNLQSVNSNGIGFGFDGILFDGATKDSMTTVTRLIPADPTQVNNITLQDSTGTLAFVTDIKREANRDYVLGIRGGTTKLLDSASAIDALFGAGFLDSARANRLSLDSTDVTAYIDSAYVQFRQKTGLDSSAAVGMGLKTGFQVDSAIDSALRKYDIGTIQVDSAITVLTNSLTGATTDVTPEDSAGSNGGAGPTNLYFTTARANTAIDNRVTTAFVDALNVDAETLGGQTLANLQADYQDATEVQTLINNNFDAVGRDLVPATDEVYDLGTAAKKWKDLHLSGTTIFLGGGELKFENSEFRFGGGTLGVNDALVLDSGQRLFFDSAGGAPNITKSNVEQTNGIAISANALSLRTTDDVDGGWYIRTNSPANGAFSVMGTKGLVFLPQNTTINRTQYQTNVLYSDDYRKGGIHYNTDLNKFEFADSDGWYAIDRNAVTSAAAQYLQFGLNATLSGAGTAQSVLGSNGSSVGTGVVMPVAGTVTNMTVSSTTNAHSGGSLTHSASLYKNNQYQSGISVEVTSAGAVGLSGSFNTTFAAGDRLKVQLDNDTGLDTEDHIVIVRFVES